MSSSTAVEKVSASMTYRYKAKNGRIREGEVEDLKSSAFYRVVAALKVGRAQYKVAWVGRHRVD